MSADQSSSFSSEGAPHAGVGCGKEYLGQGVFPSGHKRVWSHPKSVIRDYVSHDKCAMQGRP